MSRYDGLIIPRSYSEYINKTDAATLLQALQQSGVMDAAPTAGSNHPVKSGGVATALAGKQATLTFDNTPTSDSNNPVKSSGIYNSLVNKYSVFNDGASLYIKINIATGDNFSQLAYMVLVRHNNGGTSAYIITINRYDLATSDYAPNSVNAFSLFSGSSKLEAMKWNTAEIIFKTRAANWQGFAIIPLIVATPVTITQGDFATEYNSLPYSKTL